MLDLTYNYQAPKGENRHHIWSVVGQAGGVNIWAHPSAGRSWADEFYGGVEVHSRKPMYGDSAPSHDECWLIGGPCWHDGSSLYFSEHIEPMLRGRNGDFSGAITEYINSELFDWYRSKLDAATRQEAPDA